MFGFESMLEEPEGLYDEELSGVEKRRSSNIVTLQFLFLTSLFRRKKKWKDSLWMTASVI